MIGLTSAGSGTLIAIILIAVFRLTPQRVVGTDIFHAAVLLWAAGAAHWIGGNVDFGLAGNILVGSIPGVLVGGQARAQDRQEPAPRLAVGRPDRLRHHPDDEGGRARSSRSRRRPSRCCSAIVFTYILRREVKLPHGEGVRAYKLVSVPWTRTQGLGSNGDDPSKPKEPTGYDPGFKD